MVSRKYLVFSVSNFLVIILTTISYLLSDFVSGGGIYCI